MRRVEEDRGGACHALPCVRHAHSMPCAMHVPCMCQAASWPTRTTRASRCSSRSPTRTTLSAAAPPHGKTPLAVSEPSPLRLLRAHVAALGGSALSVVKSPSHWVPRHRLECSSSLPPKSPASHPIPLLAVPGTGFWAQDSLGHRVEAPTAVLRPPAGTALLFGGHVTHAGIPVTAGERAVFVASFSARGGAAARVEVAAQSQDIYGDLV